MTLTLGSLCSGIDGLALGVERAVGARTAWQSEVDPHASTALAARWPGVPNLGDLRAVDWSQAQPVDLVCAGFPCQPVSNAGQRLGVGDERWLWDDIAAAVGRMDPRPRLLLLENVPGLLTANDGDAMARVVHGLAGLGFVGRYRLLRSSDVGAPHRRERIFVAAAHAGGARAGRHARPVPRPAPPGGRPGADVRPAGDGRAAPADADVAGWEGHGPAVQVGRCQPASGPASGPSPDADGERLALWPEHHGEADPATEGHHQLSELDPDGRVRWGVYEPAVRRWEAIHGPAPSPRDDRGRLNPELPEWMMGLPPGWVTGLDIPRTAQLRLIGNACQPQVVELAARLLLLPLLATEAAA